MWQTLKNVVTTALRGAISALKFGGFWGWLAKLGLNILLNLAIKVIDWAARKGEAKEVERKTEDALKRVKDAKNIQDKLAQLDRIP